MAARIEDYALIGDSHSAALVSSDGSIDWLCLPRFDSPACFAALLGKPENGCWRIAPADNIVSRRRQYRPDTLVLDTEFETRDGRVRLTDFMPVGAPTRNVVRLVTGLAGQVAMRMDLRIRFDYGRLVPWVSRCENGALVASAGPHRLILRTPAPHRGEDFATVSEFTVSQGETIPFLVAYGRSYAEPPAVLDPEEALQRTIRYWKEWTGLCDYDGPWREAVIRSLITLKALTYAPTGGILAAPTTSLPESLAGARNWDYRYCWLRDATFTLLSLMVAGHRDEAEHWREWLVHAIAGKASQVQPLYTIRGENRIDEWEVPWLAGFAGSSPVRIGNAAFNHLQLDVFGEVLDALHQARRNDLAATKESWALQKALLEHLEEVRHMPDHGIWEVRGEKQHFTHSKVMIWVAFDRAVAAVEEFALDGPVEHWRNVRDEVHREICDNAFDSEIGAFVRAYGSKELDASTLLIALVGFLPTTDPRVVGTVAAIRRHLVSDGLVHRYDTNAARDGLPPGEGVFLACTFWLADNLILQGHVEQGQEIFERLLAIRNDVGLLSEEYDVQGGMQLGNFPQALSHLALVDTAYNLLDRKAPARQRGKHSRQE
jgi:GH15 family glucan-1,4-alpha-glucosidase